MGLLSLKILFFSKGNCLVHEKTECLTHQQDVSRTTKTCHELFVEKPRGKLLETGKENVKLDENFFFLVARYRMEVKEKPANITEA